MWVCAELAGGWVRVGGGGAKWWFSTCDFPCNQAEKANYAQRRTRRHTCQDSISTACVARPEAEPDHPFAELQQCREAAAVHQGMH